MATLPEIRKLGTQPARSGVDSLRQGRKSIVIKACIAGLSFIFVSVRWREDIRLLRRTWPARIHPLGEETKETSFEVPILKEMPEIKMGLLVNESSTYVSDWARI
jgi:hypothetical protein